MFNARRNIHAHVSPATTSRYSDTTIYNKFRRRARCVRYLDAPTSRASCPAPILRPSRIPDTYQRNYEICKQTRCNGGRAMFPSIPGQLSRVVPPEIEVTSIRRRGRKHPGELAVCFLRKTSRAFLAIFIRSPRRRGCRGKYRPGTKLLSTPSSTNYFDAFDRVRPRSAVTIVTWEIVCYLRSLEVIPEITLCVTAARWFLFIAITAPFSTSR